MLKQLSIFIFLTLLSVHTKSSYSILAKGETPKPVSNLAATLNINSEALNLAIKGFEKLKEQGLVNNMRYLTIIDFSKPSSANRFYVIDMENEQLVLQTLVAHGRKSGSVFANTFSNQDASFKSSLGFYLTANTYIGKHGLTLQLQGLEKGINDRALERAIVLHGADYVSEAIAKQQGYIGTSLGCPAVPNDKINTIIETIQGASCLFVYAPSKEYLHNSTILN
jgi:hypothetical protein